MIDLLKSVVDIESCNMTAMQKWIADFLFMVMDSETTFVDAGMIGVVGGVTVI